ncbi:hypothetical protein EE612_032165 [Oryza sativa]|nr:hypothetical protein EE612_032165 [Oryza sativa]
MRRSLLLPLGLGSDGGGCSGRRDADGGSGGSGRCGADGRTASTPPRRRRSSPPWRSLWRQRRRWICPLPFPSPSPTPLL